MNTRSKLFATLALLAGFALWSTAALGQAGKRPGSRDHGHGHGHGQGQGRGHGHGHAASALPKKHRAIPSRPLHKEQKVMRMERIEKRWKMRKSKRTERRKDRRRALRRIVRKRLHGRALNDQMRKEMKVHAGRVARLRRIRYLAASASDYALVKKTDGLIAREQSRHNGWWRQEVRKKSPKPQPEEAKR